MSINGVLDAARGSPTAALATAAIAAPTATEWKQLGLAALSAIIVAAINVLVAWVRARVPAEPDIGGNG